MDKNLGPTSNLLVVHHRDHKKNLTMHHSVNFEFSLEHYKLGLKRAYATLSSNHSLARKSKDLVTILNSNPTGNPNSEDLPHEHHCLSWLRLP